MKLEKSDSIMKTRLKEIRDLIKKKTKATKPRFDVGCGGAKQPGFIGMDKRNCLGVDIVWDVEVVPYPIPQESFSVILASHLVEHLKPWLMIDIMNEWWRLLEVSGQLWLAMPYPGSFGFWQDPTHIKSWNEATPFYFDPKQFLYSIYKPKPWKIISNSWNANGNIEIVLEKISEEDGNKIFDLLEAERAKQGVKYGA